MGTDIVLAEESATYLQQQPDLRTALPAVENYSTVFDFTHFKAEGLAARVFTERVYTVMAVMVIDGLWEFITAPHIFCYDCGLNVKLTDLNSPILDETKCPTCGSYDVILESVPAFEDVKEFYSWATEQLNCSKRSIDLRIEFYKRAVSLGVDMPTAFAGLTRWGVNWMFLARKLSQAVERADMEAEEAADILLLYDNFDSAGKVRMLVEELEVKDTIEVIAVPDSPDIIVQGINSHGEIKWEVRFMGILTKQDGVIISEDKFWDTQIGNWVARKIGIQTGVTYRKGLDLIPAFDFESREKGIHEVLTMIRWVGTFVVNNPEEVSTEMRNILGQARDLEQMRLRDRLITLAKVIDVLLDRYPLEDEYWRQLNPPFPI